MDYRDDDIALAAEYALGTLDAAERARVETMMSADEAFAVIVQAWEQKLGALNQMVGSVEPRPEVWEKIRAAIGHAAVGRAEVGHAAVGHVEPQAPIALPQDPPPPVFPSVEELAGVVDNSNVIRLAANARRWRSVATFTSAIAAALVAMIGIGIAVPDWLPDSMRPRSRTQIVEVKTPAAPAPSAQYVALLQREGGAPAFILTVDGATKNFTVRKVGAAPEPGKSFELWLISDKLPRPRSLGVIGGGDFTARPLLASYDADTVKGATYAVTVEQAGGSPDGNPHSAPVFSGKLIETVPTPATPGR
jgi:anti-sigma-K factor RskA